MCAEKINPASEKIHHRRRYSSEKYGDKTEHFFTYEAYFAQFNDDDDDDDDGHWEFLQFCFDESKE